MKKYLKDLEAELKKNQVSEEEIAEILQDHEEMINSALNEGLSEEELYEKFGDPKDVAEELSADAASDNNSSNDDKETSEGNEAKKVYEFTGVLDDYNVNITLVNEDVFFKLSNEDKITVEAKNIDHPDRFTVKFVDNELVITSPKNYGFKWGFFRREGGKFIVTLPKEKAIDKIGIKLVNGDVSMHGLKIKHLKFESTNGDMKLDDLIVDEFQIRTVNGDIDANDLTAGSFNGSMVNGDMKLKGITVAGDIVLNTVSGDIKISDSSCEQASMRTVSGDLKGKEFYPKKVSLASVSGDIVIENNDDGKTIEVLRKKSLSGDIRIKGSQK